MRMISIITDCQKYFPQNLLDKQEELISMNVCCLLSVVTIEILSVFLNKWCSVE